jgi:hypothetical protein
MTAISAAKSPALNKLEGYALSALFQGFPIYAMSVLMLKIVGAHEIVGEPRGAAIFVVLASLTHALLVPPLGKRFPNRFRYAYEPLFYDEHLGFAEKIARWRVQPMASVQLVTWMLLLSVLAVGVASLR